MMKLSIVIPAYNEGTNISQTLKNIIKDAEWLNEPYEIIVVSDGSTDDTVQQAQSVSHPRICVYTYDKNQGKGYALTYGVERSSGEYVTFIDAGGDFDSKHIGLYMKLAELMDADIVLGSKRHPMSQVNYPLHRRFLSLGYHWLVRILFHLKVRDTQTGFKLFRSVVLKKTLPRLVVKKYAFDLELLVAASRLGFTKITEAPVKMQFNFQNTSLGPKAIMWMILDTLAIFYRRYILRYYDAVEGRLVLTQRVAFLGQFPKVRPELPPAFKKIYTRHYKENRHGSTPVSSLSKSMEAWVHKRVASDVLQDRSPRATLEIGAGTLNHLPYEPDVSPYDIVEPFSELYRGALPLSRIRVIYTDTREIELLPQYDRIVSIGTFEHICNLPEVIARVGLLLKPHGILRVGIPSEGTLLWTLGWKLTTGLEFRLRYGLDYSLLMRYEHVNTAKEIEVLFNYFFNDVDYTVFGVCRSLSLYQVYYCAGPIQERCREYLKPLGEKFS